MRFEELHNAMVDSLSEQGEAGNYDRERLLVHIATSPYIHTDANAAVTAPLHRDSLFAEYARLTKNASMYPKIITVPKKLASATYGARLAPLLWADAKVDSPLGDNLSVRLFPLVPTRVYRRVYLVLGIEGSGDDVVVSMATASSAWAFQRGLVSTHTLKVGSWLPGQHQLRLASASELTDDSALHHPVVFEKVEM